MSWLAAFDDELGARRVRRPARTYLVAELADHLGCEEDASGDLEQGSTGLERTRLGDPREIAGQCAEELAADDVRRGALDAFVALAFTAFMLAVSQLALGRIGYPGDQSGISQWLLLPAILGLVVGAQVALVAGILAAWHALRRRSVPMLPAAELGLLRRRTQIALVAGLIVCLASALYVINFEASLPPWWLALSGGLALAAAGGLAWVWRGVSRGARTLTLIEGAAGDIYDDLPPLRSLRGHPWRLWGLATVLCGGAFTVFVWHAERSLIEGVERGGFEAAAFSICFVALARAVGARS